MYRLLGNNFFSLPLDSAKLRLWAVKAKFLKKMSKKCCPKTKSRYFCTHIKKNNDPKREMAEWSIAAVLKTADCNRSGGSNPSLSADLSKKPKRERLGFFVD